MNKSERPVRSGVKELVCGAYLRRGISLSGSGRMLRRIRVYVLFDEAISYGPMFLTAFRQNLALTFRAIDQCHSCQWRFHLQMDALLPEAIFFSPPIGNA